jgi:recombination protein RecA
MFGNPETTTGGMALRFYASVRLDVRRTQAIKDGGEATGNRVRVTIKKNKVAPPFKQVEFDIMYNQGISRTGDVLDLAVETGIVDKRGAFYSYGDIRLAQGRENAKGYLSGNQTLLYEIENKIRLGKELPMLRVPENLQNSEFHESPDSVEDPAYANDEEELVAELED